MKTLILRQSSVLLWAMSLVAPTLLAAADDAGLQRFSFTEVHMGAPWKIVLYAADETAANRAAQAAFARIEELNKALSDYDPESELSRLSDTSPSPQPVPVSNDFACNGLSEGDRSVQKTRVRFLRCCSGVYKSTRKETGFQRSLRCC